MTRTRMYLILQAMACALLAALLAASAISIYLEGAARKALKKTPRMRHEACGKEGMRPFAPAHGRRLHFMGRDNV